MIAIHVAFTDAVSLASFIKYALSLRWAVLEAYNSPWYYEVLSPHLY